MPQYFGIDIGKVNVKCAVLRTAYRKTQIIGLASVAVSEAGGTAEAIKAAVTKASGGALSADGIATAIEGTRSAVHTIEIPLSAQKQLAEVLPFELEAQTPFDVAESMLDYRTVGKTSEVIKVLAVMARTEDVRARIEMVKGAIGTEPDRVGVGAFPFQALVPYTPQLAEPGPIAILDLGARESELLILQSGEAMSSRALSCGTDGLPAAAPKLAREIRRSLKGYKAQGNPEPVALYLCGGGAFVSGAESFLSAELEIPVHQIPTPQIELGEAALPLQAELPLYAKAIGLAMGETARHPPFDMRKGALAYERGFGWIREKVPVLVGLGAVIATSFIFSTCTALYAANKERAVLETSLGQVTKDVLGEETTSASRAQELLVQQGTGDEDPLPHADAFDVMVRLSEHIPQSMTHDIEELDVQKGHVVVHGIVSSVTDAQSISSSLSKNEKCFQDVKITRTSQVVGGERQKYVLEFDIKCPEDVKEKKKNAPGSPSASASGGK